MSRRAAAACGTSPLRNPWTLLLAGVGGGAAWAIGLPPGAAGIVGAGMLGVATVAGVVRGTNKDIDAVQPSPPRPRAGTAQSNLVNTLHDYRVGLERLQRAGLAQSITVTADQATQAARTAETTANRVARAVDAVDRAVSRADRVVRQMARPTQVQASVQRMRQRRSDLLAGLTNAVDEIGEAYAKLLELSTTANLLGLQADETTEAAQVSRTVDALRGVFAELEAAATATRASL